jgi:serine/threonine protein phosphatase PrpC
MYPDVLPSIESHRHEYILGGSTGTNKEGKEGKTRVSDETYIILGNGASGVFDGIGSYRDSLKDAEFASKKFEEIFGGEIDLTEEEARGLIETFNKKINDFAIIKNGYDTSKKPKVGCTISFTLPIIFNDNIAIMLYSNGDSPIFGINNKGNTQQLTLNSHRLFRGFENLEKHSKLSVFAKKIQQYTTDALIKIVTASPKPVDTPKAIKNYVESKLKHEYPNEFESLLVQFLKKTMRNVDLIVNNINLGILKTDLQLILNDQRDEIVGSVYLSESDKLAQLRTLKDLYIAKKKEIDFAQQYYDFHEDGSFLNFLKIYTETMNRLDRFQEISIINPKEYLAIVVATDGVSESVQSKNIGKCVTDGLKNNQNPNDISSALISQAQNGTKKDDSTVVILNLNPTNHDHN